MITKSYTAYIRINATLRGTLSACKTLSSRLSIGSYDSSQEYNGEYQVVPRVTEQILETENKRMAENLTIRAIPYYKVSNIQNGQTIYIGSELDYGN